MRIGTPIYTWDDCGKCVLYDEEHGCKHEGVVETTTGEGGTAVVCLTGQMSECDDYADVDWEEPWE